MMRTGHISRLLIWQIITLVFLTISGVNATPIVAPITSMTGTVDPITYTQPFATATRTFTTSPITVSLSNSSPSFLTFDTNTGMLSDHLVLDVSFNNGKPGELNANIAGVLTVNESGPGPTEVGAPDTTFSTNLTVENAVLSGAGEFTATAVKGLNPTVIIWDGTIITICWYCGIIIDGKEPSLFVDLPSNFVDGQNIPLFGQFEATAQLPSSVVPEPSSISLLAVGLLALIAVCGFRSEGVT